MKNVDAIEKTRDASLKQMSVNAAARTSSSGNFNHNPNIANLHSNSEKNIQDITLAVKEIVNNAINKDYTIESCLSFLTSWTSMEPEKLAGYAPVKDYCIAHLSSGNLPKK